MTKAIIFDYDGVLNFAPLMFSERVIPRKPELNLTWEEDLKSFFKNVFDDCKLGDKDLKEELSQIPEGREKSYFELWGFNNVDELLKFWFEGEQFVYNEMMVLIESLRDKKVLTFIATNNEKYLVETIENNIGKHFDIIFSSAELHCMKPESKFYEKILFVLQENMDVYSGDVFYIDDELENTESAEKLGMKVFHMQNKEDLGSLKEQLDTFVGGNE